METIQAVKGFMEKVCPGQSCGWQGKITDIWCPECGLRLWLPVPAIIPQEVEEFVAALESDHILPEDF